MEEGFKFVWIKKPQVSLEEEAYARKHGMEHRKYDLELSIVKHGSTIYLGITSDIQEGHKNLQDIFTKMVLSL